MIGLGFCEQFSNWDSLIASNCIWSKRPAVKDASILDLANGFEIAIAHRSAVFTGLALNNVLAVFMIWGRRGLCSESIL